MNLAVLVLLLPPVALFCAFFVVAYRYRKAPEATAAAVNLNEQSIQGRATLRENSRGERRGRLRGDGGGSSGDGPRKIAEAT